MSMFGHPPIALALVFVIGQIYTNPHLIWIPLQSVINICPINRLVVEMCLQNGRPKQKCGMEQRGNIAKYAG